MSLFPNYGVRGKKSTAGRLASSQTTYEVNVGHGLKDNVYKLTIRNCQSWKTLENQVWRLTKEMGGLQQQAVQGGKPEDGCQGDRVPTSVKDQKIQCGHCIVRLK